MTVKPLILITQLRPCSEPSLQRPSLVIRSWSPHAKQAGAMLPHLHLSPCLSPSTCHGLLLQGCLAGNKPALCPVDLALGNGALSSSTLIQGGYTTLAPSLHLTRLLASSPCSTCGSIRHSDISQRQRRQEPGLFAVVGQVAPHQSRSRAGLGRTGGSSLVTHGTSCRTAGLKVLSKFWSMALGSSLHLWFTAAL